MTDGQERAWTDLAPRYVIDAPRDAAATSIRPGAAIDPREVWGRDAPARRRDRLGSGPRDHPRRGIPRPDVDFLAVEVFTAGLARTMLDAERAGVDNLRLVEANAPEVLEHLLPPASVDELWVFFPDPWHKTKHTKRRLVTPEFAAIAAGALRDGGILRLATDWEQYARQMRDVLDAAPGVLARVRGGVGASGSTAGCSPRSSARARARAAPSATSPTRARSADDRARRRGIRRAETPEPRRRTRRRRRPPPTATAGGSCGRSRTAISARCSPRSSCRSSRPGMWAVVMVYAVIAVGRRTARPVARGGRRTPPACSLCAIPGGIVADRVSRRLIVRAVSLDRLPRDHLRRRRRMLRARSASRSS